VDTVRLKIPYAFVKDRARVNWQDVRFGLVNQLLDSEAPIEKAIDEAGVSESPSDALFDLIASSDVDQTQGLVDELAKREATASEDEIRGKWLYIVLAWLFEHRAAIDDPLRHVEQVYADFGCPDEIATFVRYMPMDGPELGAPQLDERRLFERWGAYVDDASRRYRP
jgi:hypothetical protein